MKSNITEMYGRQHIKTHLVVFSSLRIRNDARINTHQDYLASN